MPFSLFRKKSKPATRTITDQNYIEMIAFQRLLDQGQPFAEKLLLAYEEYYPFAFAIEPDDYIVSVGVHNGDNHPASTTVIQKLKAALKQGTRDGQYQAVAIFYDVCCNRSQHE